MCKPNAEGINLYLIYNIYEFIFYAEALPTEAENRLPKAILGKLSEKLQMIYFY